jgi:hypothetical protein
MGARAFRSPLCSKHFFMGNPDYAAADDGDDSSEATRLRSLILAAADSTINQTIQLRSDALATRRTPEMPISCNSSKSGGRRLC